MCTVSKYDVFYWIKASLSREKYELPQKLWFFRKSPIWSRNIYANCGERGHMGEHSGKVWISFKFGTGGGVHFTNIAVWKKRNFFSKKSSVVIDHFFLL